MRYGIFSDVHGNLEALTAVIDAYQSEKIDTYFCLGDVVGYGANPNECIHVVDQLVSQCIAGNHDWAAIEKIDITYFNLVAKQAIVWTKQHLSEASLRFLKNLELGFKNNDLILVHGTLQNPEEFIYLFDSTQAEQTFSFMDHRVCFLGHTHVPQIIIQRDQRIFYSETMDVRLEDDQKYIVNVGSVGQPRDGNPETAYCIYDTELKTVSIKRIPYNIEEAQQKIIAAGLHPFLAYRLAIGQ